MKVLNAIRNLIGHADGCRCERCVPGVDPIRGIATLCDVLRDARPDDHDPIIEPDGIITKDDTDPIVGVPIDRRMTGGE